MTRRTCRARDDDPVESRTHGQKRTDFGGFSIRREAQIRAFGVVGRDGVRARLEEEHDASEKDGDEEGEEDEDGEDRPGDLEGLHEQLGHDVHLGKMESWGEKETTMNRVR